MKKFCQIERGIAWCIFEAEETPEFAAGIVLKDVTEVSPQPQEGWTYNAETDTFSPPSVVAPVPTVEERLAQLREDNLTLMEGLTGLYEMMLV